MTEVRSCQSGQIGQVFGRIRLESSGNDYAMGSGLRENGVNSAYTLYRTRSLARADVFDYVEMFYNRTRRHSHLGGVSPEAFENASKRAL